MQKSKESAEGGKRWPADLDLRPGGVGKADIAQVQVSTLGATAWHLLTTGLHLGHAVQQLEDSLGCSYCLQDGHAD